jgi:class 3 adenylate cyclase
LTKRDGSKFATDNGELRNITVVFVDIVGSSELANRTDAEDLSDWLGDYYTRTREIVEAGGGVVTDYLGDGVVACFGLYSADELAASRAVDAAIQAVKPLDPPRGSHEQVQLRAGVATGEVATRGDSETTGLPRATGVVTTLAFRIQEVGTLGKVTISKETRALLRGDFKSVSLPEQLLKGFLEEQVLFQVEAQAVPKAKTHSGPFVGRVQECATIESANIPRLIIGEAGIGKTALTQAVTENAAPSIWISADGLRTNSSHFPFKMWLSELLGKDNQTLLGLTNEFPNLDAEGILALALIIGLPEGQPLLVRKANLTLKTLIEQSLVHALCEKSVKGCWIVIEDLHWLDNASFATLQALLTDPLATEFKIIMTSREDIKLDTYLAGFDLCRVALKPLSHEESNDMLQVLSKQTLPKEFIAKLIETSGGIPLFLQQLHKLGSKAKLAIPGTLMDLLSERIDSSGTAKTALQYASVLGRRFRLDMLLRLATSPETIETSLRQAEEHGVLQSLGNDEWQFSHALLHQAAYLRILRRTREAYHSKVATFLQKEFAAIAQNDPALVAGHYAQAREYAPAIMQYLQASQSALFHGAMADAEGHTRAALKLCDAAPTHHDLTDLKIACYTSLGSVLMQLQGFSAAPVREAFEAVQDIAQAADRPIHNSAPALFGSFSHAIMTGDLDRSEGFCDLLDSVAAEKSDDVEMSEIELAALATKNCRCFYVGNFTEQFTHIAKIRKTYDVARHSAMIMNYGMDIFAAAQMFEPVARVITGQTDIVLDLVAETDAHQGVLNIPVMKPYAQIWGAVPLFYVGQQNDALERVTRGVAEADAQGAIFWQITGRIWQGIIDPTILETPEGRSSFRTNLDTLAAIGSGIARSYFEAIHAHAMSNAGQTEQAYEQSLAAVADCDISGLHCWYPEVLRLHAHNCTATGRSAEAEAAYAKGIQIAQSQGATLWESRLRTDQSATPENMG